MIYRLLIISLIALSCGGHKTLPETVELNPKPEWTSNRPINSSYYTGIGSASKSSFPTDYSIVAKKNALSDMSSEISVVISGESFYHTIDRNKEYSEDFQSMIRSTFKEEIENYEIVDSWENENEYWIFTRISKLEHNRLKAEKKKAVLDQAYADYQQGLAYEKQYKLADALDLFSSALLSMKEYWAETNSYNTPSGSINLDKTIYNSIRLVCSTIELKTSESRILLGYDNGFSNSLSLAVQKGEDYLANIPVKYKFLSERYSKPKKNYTNTDGVATIYAENLPSEERNTQLEIWIDFEELLHNEKSPQLSEMLLSSINLSKISIPVNTLMPKVYVIEYNEEIHSLAKSLKNELQKNGIMVVTNPELADLDITLEGSTKPGGSSQGFLLSFIDFNITVEDHKSHRQIFSDAYTNIKGIHMTTEGSRGDAINNAAEKMKKIIVPKMLDILL